jgi:hypothetical protein
MHHATVRTRALICGLALLAAQPIVATAQPAVPPRASAGVDIESVRQVLESAGYSVGAAAPWGDQTLVLEARGQNGRIVRAFVYRDAQAAGDAHRQAASMSSANSYAEDVGPQLLSGFGSSTWRRNIALVQSSPDTFAELMPREDDCTDLTPVTGLDLSQRAYRVDPTIVALVDALP